eukprot:1161833-Pelagomonas_calceolata.AAC.18
MRLTVHVSADYWVFPKYAAQTPAGAFQGACMYAQTLCASFVAAPPLPAAVLQSVGGTVSEQEAIGSICAKNRLAIPQTCNPKVMKKQHISMTGPPIPKGRQEKLQCTIHAT